MTEYEDKVERRDLAQRYPLHTTDSHVCGQCSGGWMCTREHGHVGLHVAHIGPHEACASWGDISWEEQK